MKIYLGLALAIMIMLMNRVMAFDFFHGVIFDVVTMIAVPLVFLMAIRESPKGFGLRWGNVKLGLKYSAILLLVALPFMLYGSRLDEFREYYPIWRPAAENLKNFVIFELSTIPRMFATEFFYRGFLLFGLMKKTRYGNLIHSFLYMLVHIGKPGLEVPYSFFAGYAFGEVDMRCRSVMPSFLMHFVSSLIFEALIVFI